MAAESPTDEEVQVKIKNQVAIILLLAATSWFAASPAVAQVRGGAVTVRFTTFSPFIALIAGILILIFPRLLNYIVAIYLILVGLIGIFGL